jgi:hypothetical protein
LENGIGRIFTWTSCWFFWSLLKLKSWKTCNFSINDLFNGVSFQSVYGSACAAMALLRSEIQVECANFLTQQVAEQVKQEQPHRWSARFVMLSNPLITDASLFYPQNRRSATHFKINDTTASAKTTDDDWR